MTSKTSLAETMLRQHSLIEQMRLHGWTCGTGAAVLALGAGILAPLLGSVLTVMTWITGPEWHGFFIRRDATILFFLGIPLLILGAHCLDLMNKEESRHD